MNEITIDGERYKLTQIGEDVAKKLEAVTFPAVEFCVAGNKMPWVEAMDYAASLSDGWRLPTKEELQVYATQFRKAGYYAWVWSSSTSSTDFNDAWNVNIENGNTYENYKDNAMSVVFVRP